MITGHKSNMGQTAKQKIFKNMIFDQMNRFHGCEHFTLMVVNSGWENVSLPWSVHYYFEVLVIKVLPLQIRNAVGAHSCSINHT